MTHVISIAQELVNNANFSDPGPDLQSQKPWRWGLPVCDLKTLSHSDEHWSVRTTSLVQRTTSCAQDLFCLGHLESEQR